MARGWCTGARGYPRTCSVSSRATGCQPTTRRDRQLSHWTLAGKSIRVGLVICRRTRLCVCRVPSRMLVLRKSGAVSRYPKAMQGE
jgi:hypothetical protein